MNVVTARRSLEESIRGCGAGYMISRMEVDTGGLMCRPPVHVIEAPERRGKGVAGARTAATEKIVGLREPKCKSGGQHLGRIGVMAGLVFAHETGGEHEVPVSRGADGLTATPEIIVALGPRDSST